MNGYCLGDPLGNFERLSLLSLTDVAGRVSRKLQSEYFQTCSQMRCKHLLFQDNRWCRPAHAVTPTGFEVTGLWHSSVNEINIPTCSCCWEICHEEVSWRNLKLSTCLRKESNTHDTFWSNNAGLVVNYWRACICFENEECTEQQFMQPQRR